MVLWFDWYTDYCLLSCKHYFSHWTTEFLLVSLADFVRLLFFDLQENGHLHTKGIIIRDTGHHLTSHPTNVRFHKSSSKEKHTYIRQIVLGFNMQLSYNKHMYTLLVRKHYENSYYTSTQITSHSCTKCKCMSNDWGWQIE